MGGGGRVGRVVAIVKKEVVKRPPGEEGPRKPEILDHVCDKV